MRAIAATAVAVLAAVAAAIAAIVAAAALTGCAPAAVTPAVRRVVLPQAFDAAPPGASSATLDAASYFADDKLVALISEALSDNLDVQLALARVELARASLDQTRGAALPQVSAGVEGSLHKYGRYTMDGAGNASTEITPGTTVPTHLPDLFVGLQASWEPDVWGRLGHVQGAARARYLASVEGTNFVVTNVVADVALAYYELVALDRRRDVLEQTIAHQTQALEMIRVQKQAGLANELAVRQFAAQLANTQAMSAETVEQIRVVENRLNLVVGQPPHAVVRSADGLDRPVGGVIATGVPTDLLRNRPDIREAELDVRAAQLDVAAARAAFYPRLAISAELGYEAFDPRFLLRSPASLAYGLVAGLVAPIVNRRGIAAAYRTASATQVAAMVSYQSVVLRGCIEVATDLYSVQQSAEIVARRRENKDALAETVDAANELFRAGKATYLEVLLAEQKTLEAQLELIAAMRDQHLASIRLYKALGGGWRQALRG